ncbi:Uncharacterised protein [Bordetella pertussis]|nr:Uncharacterised protein [Bordetella pertussis]
MRPPVNIISLAWHGEIWRMMRCVPPAPGNRPRFTSVNAMAALSATMRRSRHRSSSVPPPSAQPLTAAMVGLSLVSKRRNT